MVTVIIPAFNEEQTITAVITAATSTPVVNEVIVIDDGSTDTTARTAEQAGALVYTLPHNAGKGAAMQYGVMRAKNDIICFLDADTIGLTPAFIRAIADPVIEGVCDMKVGLRDRHVYWLNRLLYVAPILGGERAMTKRLWNQIPEKYKRGFKIEVACNYFAKNYGNGMRIQLMRGVTQVVKEKKRGLLRGLAMRVVMCADVFGSALELYIGETIRRKFLPATKRTVEK